MSSNLRLNKICQHCNQEFVAQKSTTKYCTLKCAQRAYKARVRKEKVARVQTEVEKTKTELRIAEIQEKQFLSIQETCLLSGISRMSLHRHLKKKTLNAVRLGGRIIIERKTIDQYFYGNTSTNETNQ